MEQTRQVRESDGESTDSPCLRGYCLLLLVVGEVDDNARIGSNYPRVGFYVSEFNVTDLLFEALEFLKECLTAPGIVDCWGDSTIMITDTDLIWKLTFHQVSIDCDFSDFLAELRDPLFEETGDFISPECLHLLLCFLEVGSPLCLDFIGNERHCSTLSSSGRTPVLEALINARMA